jgi:hypothetical protein
VIRWSRGPGSTDDTALRIPDRVDTCGNPPPRIHRMSAASSRSHNSPISTRWAVRRSRKPAASPRNASVRADERGDGGSGGHSRPSLPSLLRSPWALGTCRAGTSRLLLVSWGWRGRRGYRRPHRLAPAAHRAVATWSSGRKGDASAGSRRLALLNDIDTGRGNIDHLLIGPPGVFLLDSKNLSGVLSVKAGVLSVRWREDPDDGYENFRLPASTSRQASAARNRRCRTCVPGNG